MMLMIHSGHKQCLLKLDYYFFLEPANHPYRLIKPPAPRSPINDSVPENHGMTQNIIFEHGNVNYKIIREQTATANATSVQMSMGYSTFMHVFVLCIGRFCMVFWPATFCAYEML